MARASPSLWLSCGSDTALDSLCWALGGGGGGGAFLFLRGLTGGLGAGVGAPLVLGPAARRGPTGGRGGAAVPLCPRDAGEGGVAAVDGYSLEDHVCSKLRCDRRRGTVHVPNLSWVGLSVGSSSSMPGRGGGTAEPSSSTSSRKGLRCSG